MPQLTEVKYYFTVQVTDIQTVLQTSESMHLSDATSKLQITDARSPTNLSLSDTNIDLTSGEACHHALSLTHGIERFDKLESVPEDAKESEEEFEASTVDRKSSKSFIGATRSESDLPLKDSREPPETLHIESRRTQTESRLFHSPKCEVIN